VDIVNRSAMPKWETISNIACPNKENHVNQQKLNTKDNSSTDSTKTQQYNPEVVGCVIGTPSITYLVWKKSSENALRLRST
jgi:hypothetical protein